MRLSKKTSNPTPRGIAHESARSVLEQGTLYLTPLARAIALLVLAGSAQAAQPAAFSSGWFAAKGAAQATNAARPGGLVPGAPPPLAQQQKANQQLQRSLNNLNNTVAAIAAQQALQAAGRTAAFASPETIHNGLGGNGLNLVIGADGKPVFSNVEAPVQSEAGGKTQVAIKQTADKAIINWETFNVGRDTTVDFQQNADWAVLNRVNNTTAPSQIQGAIRADGTVLILNQNGIVFSGSSQINVRNLVAAATAFDDSQFRSNGLYSPGTAPTFTNAGGKVRVEQGASIETHAPATSTAGGGYVLLLGSEVDNAGTISTQKGQVALAAGGSFVIKKGQGTDGNVDSTVRGNQVLASGVGQASNSGLLQAALGDVSLTGQDVRQDGVALASTSVDSRGTLHLTASRSVTLGEGATSAILLDSSSALDSQRSSLMQPLSADSSPIVTADGYRRDQSLIAIDSAGTVDFQKGSITLASGGQVGVRAAQRSRVGDGAIIDVSGELGVKVAMESNSIKVNVQGNEQRDASANRDQGSLNSQDVWVDTRELVFVPAGTNGYASDRWYTAGGLLEVGGYLGTRVHSVGEWMAQGGTVSFSGNDVVTVQGSQINLSGGTLDVQSGMVKQSWLKGADGRLYEVSSAPGDILYEGLYQGYEDHSERWNQSHFYYSPLIAPRERFEQGYSVGRDAGTLVIGTRNAVLEGQVVGDTFQSDLQVQAAQVGLDAYNQSVKAVARGAQLVVGSYVPYYVKSSGTLQYALRANAGTLQDIVLGTEAQSLAAGLGLDDPVTAEREGRLYLDSDQLNGFSLGAVRIAATGSIKVEGDLQVAPAGSITLYGPQVEVDANLTARGGDIALGNVLQQISSSARVEDTRIDALGGSRASVRVGEGVTLDTRGAWSNQVHNPNDVSALPYLNGGNVSLRSSGDLTLAAGSLIDVSSGAALLADGKQRGGKGGNLTLAANANTSDSNGVLSLDGEVRGHGVSGGGRLNLQAGRVTISDQPVAGNDAGLLLGSGFFNKGFSAYDITGNQGLTVSDGTQLDVSMPVYHFGENIQDAATGSAPQALLSLWTPQLYQQDPVKGLLSQRKGANLSLQAGSILSTASERETTALLIGTGARISVDPGSSLSLASVGQLSVDGQLDAWGGRIQLTQIKPVGLADIPVAEAPHQRSILLGEHALLDVSARAVTAVDAQRRRYGRVDDAGSIVIGGSVDTAQGTASAPDLFVVVERGARLLANGAQAELDIRGQGATTLSSTGGSIALSSNNGLRLDGEFQAASGGVGAAGGSLSVALETPLYDRATVDDQVRVPRELVLSRGAGTAATDSLMSYGQGRLDVDKVGSGGFANLTLLSNGILSFAGDMDLNLTQSLQIYAGSLALAEGAPGDSRISLNAPYVRLAGAVASQGTDVAVRPTVQGGLSVQDSAARLEVNADLLDLRDVLTLGAHGTLERQQGPALEVDRRGFAQAQLSSRGDMRFLGGSPLNIERIATQLLSNADLALLAAQIYPTTGATALVKTTADSTLRIGRTSDTLPAQPYSVFGSLSLDAGTLLQGGVLRAPLGLLSLGEEVGNIQTLKLLPGSVTSVSAAGLNMPYGGTVDGLSYRYNGKDVELIGVAGGISNNLLSVGVSMTGHTIDVQPGAVLDLSGGGELAGAGFISGRGGSTDARYNPLVQIGADGRLVLPGLDTNPVYAIVPGEQRNYAPPASEAGVRDPLIGQRITLDAGVPGLPAGTYTLLPSTYALLPGAFRVELNGLASSGKTASSLAMRNGSWATSGGLSIVHSDVRDALSSQVILTSADVLRRYSQYNETGYAAFAAADAALKGVPRPMIEADGKTLKLTFKGVGDPAETFRFDGTANFKPAQDGLGGSAGIFASARYLEVLPVGQQATPGFAGASLYDQALNALQVPRLSIGALPGVLYGQGGNLVTFNSTLSDINLRQGSSLKAGEVFLVTNTKTGAIVIEQGASINTLGQGSAPFDSRSGFIYDPGQNSLLAVSNGWLEVLPPTTSTEATSGPGSILIGLCASDSCGATTELYSQGTITAATNNTFNLDESVRFGTRNLTLAVGAINIGSAQALAAAGQRQALPQGLTLNQQVLDRLLRGDTAKGAPALENLVLNARDSVNFYESVELSTLDPLTGQSSLQRLVLGTPAIYGYGAVGDRASIRTGTLVWNGAATAPGAPLLAGPGNGSGVLDIQTQVLEFGYGPNAQANNLDNLQRLALGFSQVNLTASQRITANHKGALQVYQLRGDYVSGKGYSYSGGDLRVNTPLWTGEAGSVNRITAGGALTVAGIAGLSAIAADNAALGAELQLEAGSLLLDSTVRLPSGKLTLGASGDVVLGDNALVDLAGREVVLNDVRKYSWGGDLILDSRGGNIRQATGSTVDLSARNNRAGLLSAIALDPDAGLIDLQGRILGSASGSYNAGGTLVPYAGGAVSLRGQSLGDFAALNTRLNRDQVFGSRSFQLKQGDLVIGNELKANEINVSVDNGNLTVVGTVDASGQQVGSIRLAARQGLTVAGSALLDAHGSLLRVDSYGKIIDSPNRALIELNSGDGQLTLASGARFDLRHGTDAPLGNAPGQNDGRARGTLELNAPRLRLEDPRYGDIAIDASGNLSVLGARSISVNAIARYTDARDGSTPAVDGRPYQVIDQDYLNAKHLDSQAFIDAALANGNLLNGKLAGLNNATYADALHLRPGVEILSKTADGDLLVQGDLDLSGYRYASLNRHTQKTDVYGSGEPGSLVVRAGGNLNIYGSISDGFAPPEAGDPAERTDGNGWLLIPGKQPFGADLVVPGAGVELAEGTLYPAGSLLNYDLPFKGASLPAGLELPTAMSLGEALNLPAGTLLQAAIHDAGGNLLYAAGTLLSETVTLPADTRLDAGTRLSMDITVKDGIWPKGVAVPRTGLTLRGAMALATGALIPSGTDVKLAEGVDLIELRPVNNGVQGRNWAVASLLPEGSQSWSMRWVAGADTEAADTRLTRPHAEAGSLQLADGHYLAKREQTGGGGDGGGGGTGLVWSPTSNFGTPGDPVPPEMLDFCTWVPDACVPAPAKTQLVWSPTSNFGTPGDPVPPEMLDFCTWVPDACMPAPAKTQLVWSPTSNFGTPGDPVPPDMLDFCTWVPDACVVATVPEEPGPTDPIRTKVTVGNQLFSVLRTGTGDLDLLSAGDFNMHSLFGVYTAGAQSASLAPGANDPYQQARGRQPDGSVLGTAGAAYESLTTGSAYQAWYPEQGGNLKLAVGGNLLGDSLGTKRDSSGVSAPQKTSASLGNWLWRQGTGATADPAAQIPTAWWINFGSFAQQPSTGASDPYLTGFTGIGTLGGGNLNVDVGGDAGLISEQLEASGTAVERSQGLVLAVGSSGRVAADGSLVLTGGGDLRLRVGGELNPSREAREAVNTVADLNGMLANLRGSLQLQAGAIGALGLTYGSYRVSQDPQESRAYDAYVSTMAAARGGVTLMPGDAGVSLDSRGDLVLQGVGDPGRVVMQNSTGYTDRDGAYRSGGGLSQFSLWTDNTAIDLFSVGGNLTPIVADERRAGTNASTSGGRFVYPSILRATAVNGSLYYGPSANGVSGQASGFSLMTAPSANAELQLIAADSIYAGGYAVTQSGADPALLSSPLNPGFAGYSGININPNYDNYGAGVGVSPSEFPLFSFGINTFSTQPYIGREPVRFYAVKGDIVGLRTGEVIRYPLQGNEVRYEGSGPLRVMAGRDIVNSGLPLNTFTDVPVEVNGAGPGQSTGNLIVHSRADEISQVWAGRDIRLSTFNIAGPGLLEVSAGRNLYGSGPGVGQLYQESAFNSIGNVDPAARMRDGGASIALIAGAGAQGPNYQGLLTRYLQPGAALKNYGSELNLWLSQRFGYSAGEDQALAFFASLPAEQQNVFARQIYFAELKAGGREYNTVGGERSGSYRRGREAIAALFPSKDVAGNSIRYDGDVTLYGGSGIHTDFGGDIQVLTPGGQQVFGIEGEAPPSTAGVITQGQGNIQLYSQGSILLGQSRIMTTFGGSILGWSAEGDINAGRGSKTTVVYTPPRRVYDNWGNVTLSPSVPSTGAGIATLNPIAEVAPGDIDLIAPLGTIDAGEAGIRVSGNVNIAALQVVNAANIQTQGESSGIPVVASVNTGALTSASSAASSATQAAEDVARQQQAAARQNMPSVFSVQVLSFGQERLAPTQDGASRANPGYNPDSPVQVLGAGPLSDQARQQLTEEERRQLTL
ncbi:filamentous hemagglutinin family protein [Pseudomonas chlororaphis]|uniref:filamentous haemagglutinin family protein n=1 Tax=Pseudomonas chlororaphis TaxID=587753 RepID=UPI000E0B6C8F|nr:filamentous haemagglutinin family protein [Pseudomonas chlororaphis]AZD15689.1 Filamentous hemagglutinin family outer membrane protein [Pseudomonas chlororaphis]WDH50089.1 filamentous hemagglutinin family protein [Pseudomonas chlororaphis]WDH61938.1 filamentous hemagglutinin family protein [Pseudomonas chlororaphis]WQE21194.1 filamentous hemagglutinin family protein [Pseudomonas chlororaphis]